VSDPFNDAAQFAGTCSVGEATDELVAADLQLTEVNFEMIHARIQI
jgi:hypothetical protein